MTARALQQPTSLKIASGSFLAIWSVIAAFPIFWITVMSFKSPVDAFDSNPLNVIFGPETVADGNGLSLFDIVLGVVLIYFVIRLCMQRLPALVERHSPGGWLVLGWIIAAALAGVAVIFLFLGVFPVVSNAVNPLLGPLGTAVLGATTEHYYTVWFERGFANNFANSLIVTAGVVTVSLTVGTLAGYGLARSGSVLAFWLLIIALIFRALPHSVLVAGYLPVFISSSEWLAPILGENAPTLYGKPIAVIAVLVAINQPFTIWMLRSFFSNIPADLDEAARVDGCSHFKAFRLVIMPVMWPGVITTGLFSFLLAYNDFLVTSLLLDASNQTMVPAIAGMFNRETTTTDQVVAVAAAVSITAPLFLLVMVFQRQIVSGLTAGAVKG
ncbi:carbohydrate ABC transporter permease [Sulfitobacter mediterraneus]|uniref:carbohydrate ABC transporter permease n=1 Tax=Sulfitobacter mediterraneus TaxID=83219 RepID=UPI001939BDC6|nr:carbohydrate ABC transporter permease [Sulfitobacter mediterraneus]MBM1556524.1 carbohydrate ABC transporter permease [Sulfitobacter mediterraneus]MBM1567437.1 carbohydrate ABC transporter permease [Sulfitobacter mediterraneus]MBM1571878.1 carbohydrate ABC transporter permease [Sulfitobacter mediterraneus]MBM1575667.1 carbohydrate ABC transporter permease [Sulfitobacter mediterraneus]MBM1578843.1 carbohydrate ABC transporter permease [Sulfitobacter mediterraneus]